jgi:hypothetical protein
MTDVSEVAASFDLLAGENDYRRWSSTLPQFHSAIEADKSTEDRTANVRVKVSNVVEATRRAYSIQPLIKL